MRFRFLFLTTVAGLIMTGGTLLFAGNAQAEHQVIVKHITYWIRYEVTVIKNVCTGGLCGDVPVVLLPEHETQQECFPSTNPADCQHVAPNSAPFGGGTFVYDRGRGDPNDRGHEDITKPGDHCEIPGKEYLLPDDADCEPDEPEVEPEQIADDGGGDEGCDQAATDAHDNEWVLNSFTDGHTAQRDHDSTSIDYCDHTQLVVVAARHTYIL